MEVVLRAEAVETAQPGDRCDFTGTLIVVPDVGSLNMPGARSETNARHKGWQDIHTWMGTHLVWGLPAAVAIYCSSRRGNIPNLSQMEVTYYRPNVDRGV